MTAGSADGARRAGPAQPAVTAGLPGGQPVFAGYPAAPPVPVRPAFPAPGLSRLAVIALVCAVAQVLTFGITTIPALAVGHCALHEIRRTRERGARLAFTALVLGYAGLAASLVLLAVAFLYSVSAEYG